MTNWVAIVLFSAGAAWAQQTVAIVGAEVFDGTGAEPRKVTVLVRGERIAEVGPDVKPPAEARVIEAGGQTLMPGMFDLHTHLPYSAVPNWGGDWPKILKAYLYCGVTSVVDFGIYPEMFEPMRRLLREGTVPGPRIHMAARLTTPLGHGAEGGRGDLFTLEVQTPREAKFAMDRWLRYEPDVIKVFTDGWRYGSDPDMTSMEEDTLKAIVDMAHAAGVEVLTHTVTLEKAKIAARAGVDVIAHGIGNAVADDELIELMRTRGTTYAPTLAVYEQRTPAAPGPLLRTLLEPAAVRILEGLAKRPPRRSPLYVEARKLRWKHLMENTRKLNAAGVRFGTGTDAGVTGAYHGWATLRELKLLVEGGMKPLEAMAAATGNSAKALNVDAERGFIRRGLLADLILINGAPHRRIADIEKISRVFLGGREVDREALAAAIANDEPTPLPAREAAGLIADFERSDGRTNLDTLPVNGTDSGTDNTRMTWGRIPRSEGNHALAMLARMAVKDDPFASLNIPLSKGAVEPVDASRFRGIRFEARGDGGDYRLVVAMQGVRDSRQFAASFKAVGEWSEVEVPFTALRRPGDGRPVRWTGRDLTLLSFQVARKPGELGWLEIDNLRFY
jgi:imidazolonepropionase-like amidohydrolase